MWNGLSDGCVMWCDYWLPLSLGAHDVTCNDTFGICVSYPTRSKPVGIFTFPVFVLMPLYDRGTSASEPSSRHLRMANLINYSTLGISEGRIGNTCLLFMSWGAQPLAWADGRGYRNEQEGNGLLVIHFRACIRASTPYESVSHVGGWRSNVKRPTPDMPTFPSQWHWRLPL